MTVFESAPVHLLSVSWFTLCLFLTSFSYWVDFMISFISSGVSWQLFCFVSSTSLRLTKVDGYTMPPQFFALRYFYRISNLILSSNDSSCETSCRSPLWPLWGLACSISSKTCLISSSSIHSSLLLLSRALRKPSNSSSNLTLPFLNVNYPSVVGSPVADCPS